MQRAGGAEIQPGDVLCEAGRCGLSKKSQEKGRRGPRVTRPRTPPSRTRSLPSRQLEPTEGFKKG